MPSTAGAGFGPMVQLIIFRAQQNKAWNDILSGTGFQAGLSRGTVGSAGNALVGIGIAFTLFDMQKNGVNTSNYLDFSMGVLSLAPGVGCIIGGAYFIGNSIMIETTGESIGTYLSNRPKRREAAYQCPIYQGLN